jgi:hypothetical protein
VYEKRFLRSYERGSYRIMGKRNFVMRTFIHSTLQCKVRLKNMWKNRTEHLMSCVRTINITLKTKMKNQLEHRGVDGRIILNLDCK